MPCNHPKLNFRIEKHLAGKTGKAIVGVDEAGRGPIAGPVVVGAILVDLNYLDNIKWKNQWWWQANDSKKLTAKQREEIFCQIEKYLSWSVGIASEKYIDQFGIKKAIRAAANKALRRLKTKPEIILFDGNRKFLNVNGCSERTIIKGDERLFTIACASIMAKVTRDRFMAKAHCKWPEYQFCKHKGYGTKLHLKCLKEYGPCPLHRFSYEPLKSLGFRRSFFATKRGNAGNK